MHAHPRQLWEHLNALLRELGGSLQEASHTHVTENQKPRSFLLKPPNVDSADSNEVLLWQKHQDMCSVWNLNVVRASHLTSDLGKTIAFALLMNVSVEQIRERSLSAKRGQVPGKGELSLRLDAVYLYHCNKRMTALNIMSSVCHLSVRWSGTLSQCVFFFFGHFVFFPLARVGLVKKKSDEKHRKKSTWPYII